MGLKAALSVPFAKLVVRDIRRWSSRPFETQDRTLDFLLHHGRDTAFGKDHGFRSIRSYDDFRRQVPVRDYEGLRPYIERVTAGEAGVLWKGRPVYLSKTSGTTSGTKYIPITRASMPNHLRSARNALLSYINCTGKAAFADGKMIFLSGSPELDRKSGILTGRLSGIVNHHIPAYLRRNQIPSYATNCIGDWEEKVDAIVRETAGEDMRLISGIPSWVQMYFDRLLEYTGKKTIRDIFPNFSLFVHGGVNYEPYRPAFERTIGFPVDTIELYPASEGFIAFRDDINEEGLLLVLNGGLFYEFIPLSEHGRPDASRLSLREVDTGVDYAIIFSTSAGLWGYDIGDTVRFVSRSPFRIVVTGRTKHFISAFGEHVIASEVEYAMQTAAAEYGAEVAEFTVAPMVRPPGELPYHEWFVEFIRPPGDAEAFRLRMDGLLQEKNIYYRDLLEGNILQPLKIRRIRAGGFITYMKAAGKLGGQNKIPRLSNDRSIADELSKFADG